MRRKATRHPLAAAGATAPSYLTAHPAGTTRPATSNLNTGPGSTVANRVIVAGRPAVAFTNVGGRTHLIVDIYGYFT